MAKAREYHGYYRHPLYRKWVDMCSRCHSVNHKLFPWYGAKGVYVCDEWRNSAKAFIEWCLQENWVKGLEIDKDIKCPGNLIYSPTTCSIVTHQQNMLMVVGRISGRKSSKLRLLNDDVLKIVKLKREGVSTQLLAKQYNVSVWTINRISKAN